MKTARELFKELAYQYRESGIDHPKKYIRYVRNHKPGWMNNEINFDLKLKLIDIQNTLEPEECKAIYQQVKELGWLDE